MTADASGNVGIGTSVPGAKLDVSGVIAASASGKYLNAGWSGSNAYIQTTDSSSNAYNLIFYGGASERARIDTSGNFQFNSGYGSAATAYGCRVWVNFNGTGTPAIRASGNVSSITDLGVGSYRLNFTTALPDGNYSVAGAFLRVSLPLIMNPYSYLTSSLTFESMRYDTNLDDPLFVSVSIFR
jgi:hypothetical protein